MDSLNPTSTRAPSAAVSKHVCIIHAGWLRFKHPIVHRPQIYTTIFVYRNSMHPTTLSFIVLSFSAVPVDAAATTSYKSLAL